jgi:UDP-glucose 6-dehydrogenase
VNSQLSQKSSLNIAVIGSGYVGLVAAVCFAEIGHSVVCVDNDPNRVAALSAGEVPIYEENLPELLACHHRGRLTFTADLISAARKAQVIFIAVGTPQSPTGEADLSHVEASVRELVSELGEYKVVVEKSTVPVLTSQWIRRTLKLNGADDASYDVVSNPEFLREGKAIEDFLYPDRIVVGADSERARVMLRRVYQPLIDGSYYNRPDCIAGPRDLRGGVRYLETSAESAELIKHASNAFLAMKISFINAVANLCERVGSDVQEVAEGIGSDSRIGSSFLRAGIGYGGSCFPKDVRAFYKIAESIGYDFELLRCVEKINEGQLASYLIEAALGAVDAEGETHRGTGTGVQGRDRRRAGVSRHPRGALPSGGRMPGLGLRSSGDGESARAASVRGEAVLCRRRIRCRARRPRFAAGDRMAPVCSSGFRSSASDHALSGDPRWSQSVRSQRGRVGWLPLLQRGPSRG